MVGHLCFAGAISDGGPRCGLALFNLWAQNLTRWTQIRQTPAASYRVVLGSHFTAFRTMPEPGWRYPAYQPEVALLVQLPLPSGEVYHRSLRGGDLTAGR